ncbi:hypothetical protein Vretimale_12880 [Volvox reticuliferus]|uniref:Uncharacterized protein n=1 Tax=Volvox reticuliferus TaxID=1737510 RepID=A0A8J4LSF1_9CHLO|nr:hypothetical protein Vretifemale_9263 [Volvox reticuliferus]GIM09001.1 hypothetical protein Vretimale_12880 [Volvox reticuliferus]
MTSAHTSCAVADLLALHGLRRGASAKHTQAEKLVERVLEEDTTALAASALQKLKACAAEQGVCVDDCWTAKVKVRLTTRRNGIIGRTTTNTYYSPSGKAFRSHAAVISFLRDSAGMTPLQSTSNDGKMSEATDAYPPSKRARH